MVKNKCAIVGLGNPGTKYAKTRHNIGFCIVDALACEYHAAWKLQQNYAYAEFTKDETDVLLLKPLTGMNNAGVISKILKQEGVDIAHTLVIHDELEMPFGKAVMRKGGSARGHNGLRSLIASSGADFYRLRFGIGRPNSREEVPNYVLHNFTHEEAEELHELVPYSIGLIGSWIDDIPTRPLH